MDEFDEFKLQPAVAPPGEFDEFKLPDIKARLGVPQKRQSMKARSVMGLPEPGSDPRRAIPEQHPELTDDERMVIQHGSPTIESKAINLQKLGFDTYPHGDRVAIKKTGLNKPWYLLEEPTLSLKDAYDVPGTVSDIASGMAGATKGGKIGAQLGGAHPAAKFILGAGGAVVGGGVGMASSRAARAEIARRLGMSDAPASETGRAALQGFVEGATSEGVGQGLALPARGLMAIGKRVIARPIQGLKARGAVRDAEKILSAEQKDLAAKAGALQERAGEVQTVTSGPITRKAQAKASLEDAKLRAKVEAETEAERLAQESAKRRAAKPKPEGGKLEPQPPVQPKNVIEELEAAAGKQGPNKFTFDGSSLDPRSSHAAVVLQKVPRLRKLYQEIFGPEYAPDVGDLSMATRRSRTANTPASIFERGKEQWIERMAELALDSKESRMLAPHIRSSLGRVLQGGRLPEDLAVVNDVVTSVIHKTRLPDHLRTAIKEYRETVPAAARAQAQRAEATQALREGRRSLGPKRQELRERAADVEAWKAVLPDSFTRTMLPWGTPRSIRTVMAGVDVAKAAKTAGQVKHIGPTSLRLRLENAPPAVKRLLEPVIETPKEKFMIELVARAAAYPAVLGWLLRDD